MKRILIIIVIGFVFATAYAQTDNPLKQGMVNTVTLSNGEVVCDLNGEWDAHFDYDWLGTGKDIYKINQKGNKFEGVKLIGTVQVPKGVVSIKGKLAKNGFESLESLSGWGWHTSTGEISENCDKVVIKRFDETMGITLIKTLTRK